MLKPCAETKMAGEPEESPPAARSRAPLGRRLLGWGIASVVCVILVAVLFPVFAKPRDCNTPVNSCKRNARQLATALVMYAVDHNDTFPLTSNWVQATGLSPDDIFLRYPYGEPGQVSYEFNAALSGASLASINDATSLPVLWCKYDHDGERVIVFADGHVAVVPQPIGAEPPPP